MNTPVANLRLVSGRLYWRPTGDAGYLDFGNVVAHKNEPERKRVDHFRSKRGSKRLEQRVPRSPKLISNKHKSTKFSATGA